MEGTTDVYKVGHPHSTWYEAGYQEMYPGEPENQIRISTWTKALPVVTVVK